MKKSVKPATYLRNRVLLVDDDPECLKTLEEQLIGIEIELSSVTSGKEALAILKEQQFSLLLIDVEMPEMDGYELAEILCEDDATCAIPFIFMLPEGAEHFRIFKGHEKGNFTFMLKPLDLLMMVDKIKFFIEKFRHEDELKSTKKSLKKHIRDMEVAYEELKSFSYTVSHDLRAPLRVISGYSNILIEDYAHQMHKDGVKVVNTIVRNTRKMSLLIDELLNFARLARQDKHFQEVDMTRKFESVFQELTEHILNRKINLEIKPLRTAFADQTLIRRLITNLLGNAIKYTAPRKEALIEVGGEQQGNEYIYYVKDNGVGFDDNYKDKIFGVFQRLHKESEFEGTGIGLAIVHKVVEHHGGRIWAEGAPGKGAAFYFTLENQTSQSQRES